MNDDRCGRAKEAFRRDDPSAVDRLRVHAARCDECRESLALWDEISTAGPSLRKTWESPALFPRIAAAVEAEKTRRTEAADAARTAANAAPTRGRFAWVPMAAAAALFVLAMVGLQVFRNSGGREPLANAGATKDALLSDRSLEDVETAEANYVRSIDRLSELARTRIENPTTPLLVNYREKLLVLDGAITETRNQIAGNRFNSHLRRELLAMYQEKQRTLQELMKEEKS
jgi:negative regulator of sigma E activity